MKERKNWQRKIKGKTIRKTQILLNSTYGRKPVRLVIKAGLFFITSFAMFSVKMELLFECCVDGRAVGLLYVLKDLKLTIAFQWCIQITCLPSG